MSKLVMGTLIRFLGLIALESRTLSREDLIGIAFTGRLKRHRSLFSQDMTTRLMMSGL